ncbi:uncharacterized protein LOC142981167 [Anticarsia gemmatalis]|uniref:uncharacterized protein LOC142981167 n=1 Tax=Anticarsia gemmatalis TaxID=129554 RepID=UPI003F772B58
MDRSKKQSAVKQGDAPDRRRGRPTGKNRVPLSHEERRARNALYERERRQEHAEASALLAEAVGCDSDITNAELLAKVITMIQHNTRKNAEESIDDILRINSNLESQIASLQERLGIDDESLDQLDVEQFQPAQQPTTSSSTHVERSSKKKSRKRKTSAQSSQAEKRARTKSGASTDSGVGSYSQSVSPELRADDNVAPQQQEIHVEIAEEQEQVAKKTYEELQEELFSELFVPPAQSPTAVPEWVDTNLSVPFMDSLAQSLIVVPPIIGPPEMNVRLEQPVQPGPSNVSNVETISTPEFQPQVELTLNLLSEDEKLLINDWLEKELVNSNAVDGSI